MTVHSVYKSTINVEVANWFVAIQPTGLPMTPLSVMLNVDPADFARLPIQKGDSVSFDATGLHLNGMVFIGDQAERIPCGITDLRLHDDRERERLCDEIARQLFGQVGKGEMLNAAKSALMRTSNPLSNVGKYILEVFAELSGPVDAQKAVKQSLRLIGVGEGLTPSGDDFLCGELAALLLLSNNPRLATLRIHLVDGVREKLTATTRISQEYLRHAIDGEYTALVRRLVIANAQQRDTIPVLNEIRSIGHSSGSDFLIGMYYGLTMGGNVDL